MSTSSSVSASISACPGESAGDFSEFDAWLVLRGLAVATREEYLRWLRKLATQAARPPAELDEAAVRGFLLHLHVERRAASSSLRSACAALRHYYLGYLRREWGMMALVRAPREHPVPRALTRGQVARMLRAVSEPGLRVLLRLLYACGLRLGEALGLEVGDIDGEGLHVFIRRGKGGRQRRVPLPAVLLEELRAWWRLHRNPRWLFPAGGRGAGVSDFSRRRGADTPLRAGTVQNRVRLARRAAGLPERVTPHTLRHCYATHLLEAGVCIRVISACMGHSSLEITLRYARVTPVSEAWARAAAAGLLAEDQPGGG